MLVYLLCLNLLLLQVFVTLMVCVQYQVKRVLLYEDGPPPAAVSIYLASFPASKRLAACNLWHVEQQLATCICQLACWGQTVLPVWVPHPAQMALGAGRRVHSCDGCLLKAAVCCSILTVLFPVHT